MKARLKKYLLACFNLLAYPLSGLAPRSPRVWVFGHADNQFAGNPKYLYLWLSQNRPDIEAIWVTGNKATYRLLRSNGYRARRRWSPDGMLAALRAGAFFYSHFPSDVNVALSRGARLINLWHGVGLKAISLGLATSRTSQAQGPRNLFAWAQNLRYLVKPDVTVTTSDFMQAHFASQFRMPAERCPKLGYPRLDCALDPRLAQAAERLDAASGFRWNAEGFAETYIYMPTSRDTDRPFIETALPDLDRLSAALAERNAVLYVKMHVRTRDRLPKDGGRIRAWPEGVDFQAYLHRFDGLITDYSSVLYDYLAVKSDGLLVYAFDYEAYVTKDRPLLYPFKENTAGLAVDTFEALCEALRAGKAFDPALRSHADFVRRRFWGEAVSLASPIITGYVERRLGSPNRSHVPGL